MATKLIERIDQLLIANRPFYHAHLQPGATDAQLDVVESRFSLNLSDGFRQLYHWRNGQDSISSDSLHDNLMFLSLNEITESKKLLDDMIGTDFEDPRWWRQAWLPFLGNGAGDYWCIDHAAEDGGVPGQVLIFYHDWEKRPVRFHSLEAWLENLVKSMEDGTLKVL